MCAVLVAIFLISMAPHLNTTLGAPIQFLGHDESHFTAQFEQTKCLVESGIDRNMVGELQYMVIKLFNLNLSF